MDFSDKDILPSESDEDIYADEILETDQGPTHSQQVSVHNDMGIINKVKHYKILGKTELIDEMNRLTNETTAILRVPGSFCKVLLQQFRWDKERVIERFYEAVDEDNFFIGMNLLNPLTHKRIEDKVDYCKICYDMGQLAGLLCNHLFCKACWTHYISGKIVDEGTVSINCPQHKCNLVVDDEFVLKSVRLSSSVLQKYHKLVLNSFVESHKFLRWCPASECTKAVQIQHIDSQPVHCECGHVYCFQCGQQWHEPVDCDMLRRWLKKCIDDSETTNWLCANTKDCPKCHAIIEKDGGCNHMTCKNSNCRFEFCWVCLGPWGPHGSGWYSCNRFDEPDAKKARDSQEKSRSTLERYLHYFTRYNNHQNSSKFEKKLYEQVDEKTKLMQAQGFSWIETQFLNKAVDILCDCRRTLMHTYVFAFYLLQNNITKIFEDNQKDLELATENLSEYLEKDLIDENFADLVKLKQKVQDKYRYVENRRQVLLVHCQEGHEKQQWTFNKELLNDTLNNALFSGLTSKKK